MKPNTARGYSLQSLLYMFFINLFIYAKESNKILYTIIAQIQAGIEIH